MPNNRFANLRKVKPAAKSNPPAEERKEEPKEEPNFGSVLPASEVVKRGRPRAKRSSNDFAQATAYVKKETYTAVKHLLLDQKKEYSVLVQELLDGWLQKQK